MLEHYQRLSINNDTDRTMTASFYKAASLQLHQSFISSLNELTETSSSFWRKVIIEELQEIQSQAKHLLDMNVLHELDAARLHHILGRDIKQFIQFARHKEKTKPYESDTTSMPSQFGIPS